MTISTHAKLFKRGAPIGCVLVSLTLISSVINLGWSQATSALSLGGLLGEGGDRSSNLIAPVNKTLSTVTDRVVPKVTDTLDKTLSPVTQNVLPRTTEAATRAAAPVTQNVLPRTLNGVERLTQPVLGDTLPRTTERVGGLVDEVAGRVLPETVNGLNNTLSPVTGNAVPRALDTVNNAVRPTTRALAPTVNNALGNSPTTRPLAETLTPLLQRGPLTPVTPTPANPISPVTPITTPVLSFANPSFTQSINNPSRGLQPIVEGIGNFLGFFPSLFSSVIQSIDGKKANSTTLMVATGILGAMLLAFIMTMYRMITRGKHGVHAIGQDFLLESSLYGRLAKTTAVTFGTLGFGAVLMYLTLLGF